MAYAALGFYVFPCAPDKTPYTKNGFKDASTDPEAVRRFWHDHPDAQIGVDCGRSGIVVVDLDKKNDKDGIAAFDALCGTGPHGCSLVVTSPSGGRHYIYASVPGIEFKSTTNRIAAGIDTRAQGGYVIAPSPASPGRECLEGDWLEMKASDLAPPPDWLLGHLPRVGSAKAEAPLATSESQNAWEGVGAGERNSAATQLAGKLLAHGLLNEAWPMLRAWNLQNRPPLSEDELRGVLDSVLRGDRDRHPERHEDRGSAPAEAVLSRATLRARLRTRSEIIAIQPTRWLIKNYLTRGSVVILAADPNLGKSTLANAWGHCVWMGTAWLRNGVMTGSVLFILGEDVRGASLRANAWEAEYGACTQANERYIEYADRMPPLCQPEGQVELRRLLQFLTREHGHAPALVVIDTLSTVWGSEPENATELAAALMSILSALGDEFGCTFVLIHHLNKVTPGTGRREISLSSIRGAGAFVGGADDVIVLEAVEQGIAKLFGLKARNTDKAPELMLRVQRVALGTNEDGDEVSSVILVEAPRPSQLSNEQIEAADRDRAWTAGEQRVQRAVEALRKLGTARSRTQIANRMVGKRSERFSAIDDAVSRELIIDLGTRKAPRLVVADEHPEGVRKTPHTPEAGTGNRSLADAATGSVPCEVGTGSLETGTGNRLEQAPDMDDGMPEKPGRRRGRKGKGAA